jgi:RNA polymerase sigma-70 factor (ECF subfamily)
VEHPDGALLRRVASGDRQAMQDLYAAYAGKLLQFALARVGDRELAEDIVQETMIAVWRSAESYRGGSAAGTWLFGICRHKVLDALRRCDGTDLPLPSPAREGSASLEFWESFRRLSDEQRELILLVFHYGFSQQEVADILDVPVGTVKSRTFHARRRLQALLKGGEQP